MGVQLFTNNAQSTLAAQLDSGSTSITLPSGEGAKFPSPTGGDVAILTLTQAGASETSWEDVTLTARSGDTLTVTRSASVTWAAGSKCELRVTAVYLNSRASSGANTDITSLQGLNVGPGPASASTGTRYGVGALAGVNARSVQNTAIGSGAMAYSGDIGASGNSGEGNVAVGYNALHACDHGVYNIAIGAAALDLPTNPTYNVAVGYHAMRNAASGGVAVGYQALASVSGNYNTAIGYDAGLDLSSGTNNVIIGAQSGTSGITTGSNNVILGAYSTPATQGASNVITLGNASIATLRCQVTSITSLSDIRDKTNVAPLAFGLDFLNRLMPIEFTWNTRDGAKKGIRAAGFSAQELLRVQTDMGAEVLDLVSTENPDKLEARYGHLIPVLVRAVQELSQQVRDLQAMVK